MVVENSSSMSDFIIGAAVSVISLIIGFIINVIYENYKEKRKKREESLKNHFTQLENNVIRPFSTIIGGIYSTENGLLVAPMFQNYGGDKPVWPTKNFDEGDFQSFKFHFSNFAGSLEQFIKRVDEKNQKLDSLMSQLQSDIEQNVHISFSFDQSAGNKYLDEALLNDIKETAFKIAKEKLNGITNSKIAYRLEESEVIQAVAYGTDYWQITERGTFFAFLDNETEANEVKAKLLKFINNSPIVEDLIILFQDIIKLEKDARILSNLLEFTCQQYSIYGTFIKKKKLCPICQIIFGN